MAIDVESRPIVPSSIDSAHALQILLAEDNLVNQRYARRLLERQGHSVIMASNGRDALEIYRVQPVDLVLMDIQMPGMDGFEATAEIRALEQETRQHTPIIAMTAHAMKGNRECCLEGGMDGYISKPIAQEELLSEIERVTDSSKIETEKATDRWPAECKEEVLNYENARRQVGDDDVLLGELIELHLAETPKLVEQIGDALGSIDFQTVKKMAHALKGSPGLLWAPRAYDAASSLEQRAAARNALECESQFARLIEELDQLKVALASICST